MTGPTHVSFSLCSGVLFCTLFGVNFAEPYYLIAVFLGSIAPDIDAEGESSVTGLGKIFRPLLGWKLSKFVDSVMRLISSIINLLTGHRGVTHWPILPIITLALSISVGNGFWFWFSFGYMTHLLADMMTPSGIYAFAPFYQKKISIAYIKTGSFGELFFFILSTITAIYLGYYLMPENLQNSLNEIFSKFTGA